MRPLVLLCLVSILSGCSSSPEPAYAAAREQGYTASEELREELMAVTLLEPGVWEVEFRRSARRYRILAAVSPDAAELAARAEEARGSGGEVYATILVHETAPRTKSPRALRAADEAPYPWIVARLGDDSDPALSEPGPGASGS